MVAFRVNATRPTVPDKMSDPIPPGLAQAARRALADPGLAEVLTDHHRRWSAQVPAAPIDTAIHPACQMLAHSLRAHRDADAAVSQYFSVAEQQHGVVRGLAQRLFEHPRSVRLLDFACGYGRLLRFLVHSLPPANIHAAEIQPDAVEWVRERYGVDARLSTARPRDFDSPRRYDMIWIASLFSHLPDGLFQRWLARLAGLLEDDGVICLSVHDEALLPAGMRVPESGLLYIAGSENAGLDPSIYGTTFVKGDYVERALEHAFGGPCRVRRLPRLLAHEQDVYVATRSPRPDLDALDHFRRGTRGWLDERHFDAGRATLWLKGWAGSLDEVAFGHVEVRVGDTVHRLPGGEPTPRVAEVLGHPGLADSGFSVELPAPPGAYLSLSAVAADGERALIHAGRLPAQ